MCECSFELIGGIHLGHNFQVFVNQVWINTPIFVVARIIIVFKLLYWLDRFDKLFVNKDARMLSHTLKQLLLELRSLLINLSLFLWSQSRQSLEEVLNAFLHLSFGIFALLFLLHFKLNQFVHCLVPLILIVHVEVEHLRQVDFCHLGVDCLHVRPDILLVEKLSFQLRTVDIII